MILPLGSLPKLLFGYASNTRRWFQQPADHRKRTGPWRVLWSSCSNFFRQRCRPRPATLASWDKLEVRFGSSLRSPEATHLAVSSVAGSRSSLRTTAWLTPAFAKPPAYTRVEAHSMAQSLACSAGADTSDPSAAT